MFVIQKSTWSNDHQIVAVTAVACRETFEVAIAYLKELVAAEFAVRHTALVKHYPGVEPIDERFEIHYNYREREFNETYYVNEVTDVS